MPQGATAPSAHQAAINDDALMSAQEQTPAYRALYENNLICNQYRFRRVEDRPRFEELHGLVNLVRQDLDMIKGNWALNQPPVCSGANVCADGRFAAVTEELAAAARPAWNSTASQQDLALFDPERLVKSAEHANAICMLGTAALAGAVSKDS
eukprot:Skav210630  [mRNA]  locus=scaffold1063:53492:66878:- [translate_table: standard]